MPAGAAGVLPVETRETNELPIVPCRSCMALDGATRADTEGVFTGGRVVAYSSPSPRCDLWRVAVACEALGIAAMLNQHRIRVNANVS